MWYAATAVLLLFLYFRFKVGFDRWKAAHNVVVAAYTYANLSPETQESVRERTEEILLKSGWRGNTRRLEQDQTAMYGWYALAMAELGIAPLALLDTWNHVRNPFIAISAGHKDVVSVASQLKKATGVEISIDPVNHFLNEVE